ncbi:VCBS repeat-containing protein [Sanyastnella coralliicola]|uniref:VCBS repeat-containing protein n=1 Tax=Sanyastnella coralliicola TaxID=3069118 RepID=UPI0027B97CED|nr:VCBS repeat-containing protein [Longitalea sp. SCSIO 12813]
MNRLLIFSCALALLWSCGNQPDHVNEPSPEPQRQSGFELLSEEESGIAFSNDIQENDSINVINYDYLYNGAGVAVGDVNKDGLEDLFFTGNMVADKLYLNQGELNFTDASAEWDIPSDGWSSGAVMVDINQDGWLDIYVCQTGPYKSASKHTNRLLINQEGKGFVDEAKEYGLDYSGHTTMAAFFDMDLDGDLDCYLLTHPDQFRNRLNGAELQRLIQAGVLESDKLYRNDNGKFVDVTQSAGIFDFAFGLGIVIEDFNADGWPDIYCSNDFDEGDLLYINQQNGTFVNEVTKRFKHTSNYGMGCDYADINNDLLPDLLTLDMAFETHERAKRNMASMDLDRFEARLRMGWHYQYMQNTLQLNMGNGIYSDIAQMNGMHKTDWSWAGLIADFDNDGMQDVFITNGYKRDTKDNDLQTNVQELQAAQQDITFGDVLDLLPSTKLSNYLFQNQGHLQFDRVNDQWGLDQRVNSNGAVYADLDNDGDLDLVVNNVDERAYVYRNQMGGDFTGVYMRPSRDVGSRVILRTDKGDQVRYYNPTRGYLGSVGNKVHFGVPEGATVERIEIISPQGDIWGVGMAKINEYTSLGDDKTEYKVENSWPPAPQNQYLKDITREQSIVHRHQENPFNDFEKEILLPHRTSEYGPAIASGDLNGDGYEDVYIGGCSGQPGKLYIQTPDGSFLTSRQEIFERHQGAEDVDAVAFDADNDGDLDLYVVSGDASQGAASPYLRDRLYLNEGQAQFSDGTNRIPNLTIAGGVVRAADIDNDGDQDLFIGGRNVPGAYPTAPESVVLINDNRLFRDMTADWLPEFSKGMVSSALLEDMNNDGLVDLVVAGEWMAPTIYHGDGARFGAAKELAPDMNGWWFELAASDINGDGIKDIIAGNIGENNKFHPSKDKPLFCYAADFDNSGTLDIVLAKYENDNLLPVRGKECSSEQMPFISQKFETYNDFAKASLSDIYSEENLASAERLEAYEFKSMLFLGDGQSYSAQALPFGAQMAPVRSIVPTDVDGDGDTDLIIAGNYFGVEVETVRYDAGNGCVLINDNGSFRTSWYTESGLTLAQDVRRSVLVNTAKGKLMVSAINKGYARVHQLMSTVEDQQGN